MLRLLPMLISTIDGRYSQNMAMQLIIAASSLDLTRSSTELAIWSRPTGVFTQESQGKDSAFAYCRIRQRESDDKQRTRLM